MREVWEGAVPYIGEWDGPDSVINIDSFGGGLISCPIPFKTECENQLVIPIHPGSFESTKKRVSSAVTAGRFRQPQASSSLAEGRDLPILSNGAICIVPGPRTK